MRLQRPDGGVVAPLRIPQRWVEALPHLMASVIYLETDEILNKRESLGDKRVLDRLVSS